MKRLLILFIAIVIILIAAALVQQRIHLQVHDVRDNFVTLQTIDITFCVVQCRVVDEYFPGFALCIPRVDDLIA